MDFIFSLIRKGFFVVLGLGLLQPSVSAIEVPDETWQAIKTEIVEIKKINQDLQKENAESKQALIEVKTFSQNLIADSNDWKTLYKASKIKSEVLEIVVIVELLALSALAVYTSFN